MYPTIFFSEMGQMILEMGQMILEMGMIISLESLFSDYIWFPIIPDHLRWFLQVLKKWMDGGMDGWRDGWLDGWTDEWMDGLTN